MTTTEGMPAAAAPRPWLTVAAVASAVFLSTVDGSIVNIALPTLSDEFDQPLSVVQWVVLGYLLTQSTLALLVGRLGDMIGKKRIFTAGFVVFTVFSFLAALAPSIPLLIGARVLQAIGGSMLVALGIAIVSDAFPPERRGQVLGMIGSVVSLGIFTGPTLGGIILDALSWQWIFLVNVPVGAVGTALAIRYIPATAPTGTQRFDFAGAVAFLVALLSLLVALSLGQEQGIPGAWLVGLLVASAAGLVVFVRIERRVAQPMLDLTLFRHLDFSIGLISGFLVFIAIGGLFIIGPFFLTDTLDLPPRTVGLVIASGPLLIGITSPISGRISDRVGARPVTVAGLVVVTIGFALLQRVTAESEPIDMLVGLLVIGAGIGVFQTPNTAAVMGSAPRERFGVAGSLLTLNRIVGQTIGIAALSAVWTLRLRSRTDGLTDPAAIALGEAAAFRDFVLTATTVVLVSLALSAWALRRTRAAESMQSVDPA